MLARAVFFDMITDGNYIYNAYKGNRCNIGIVKIEGEISVEKLAKIHNNSIVIVNIPEEAEALYNMIKIEHKIFDEDIDTYEISTPYIEKSWIVENIDMPKETYEFICFSKYNESVLDRYFYTKHIKNYLREHSRDFYSNEYIYNLINCIDSYIAVTDFDKNIQHRISHIICIYLKEKVNDDNEHSEEYYEYFDKEDSDDDILDKLSSTTTIMEYIRDIIVNYEIDTLNRRLSC